MLCQEQDQTHSHRSVSLAQAWLGKKSQREKIKNTRSKRRQIYMGNVLMFQQQAIFSYSDSEENSQW